MNNLDQANRLAENKKWGLHQNLFSMAMVNNKNCQDDSDKMPQAACFYTEIYALHS